MRFHLFVQPAHTDIFEELLKLGLGLDGGENGIDGDKGKKVGAFFAGFSSYFKKR